VQGGRAYAGSGGGTRDSGRTTGLEGGNAIG
jgi:hypothetical protein